jgi:O-methyltransferase involved in polyketide biosynthesis
MPLPTVAAKPGMLLSVGFDPAIKAAWIAEGLLGYLTMEQAKHLVAEAASLSAAGSWLLTQYIDAKAAPRPAGTFP